MNTGIEIRRAGDGEIDALMAIYLDKVRWLRERGTPMWDESQFTRDSLKDKYLDPEYYIAVKDGEIIGGFILIEYDGRYWPENGADAAYYFHKFVVKNEYCGKGYSGQILRWVQEYGRAKGKQFIRLDFDERRAYLKEMYISNDFVPADRKPNEKGHLVTKAEYRIGTLS
jgi:GNAT superfamily N-acetyltransferase